MNQPRWLSVCVGSVLTAGISLVGVSLPFAMQQGSPRSQPVLLAGTDNAAGQATTCPMFGCTPQRNMVNTIDKNIPTQWNVEEGKLQNVKWVAELGNPAYGGPVVADGKVFVGTNNAKPRDPKITDKVRAVLMAFNEADGKFLWQITHAIPDELPKEARVQGLCSTPVVENKRLYYVTPGCEVICAGTDGKVQWTYDMMKKLKVSPFHLANCSPLIAGDLVMVVTGNGVNEEGELPAPKAPSFIALNKIDGTLVWQSNLPGEAVMEGQWSNPTLAVVNGKSQVIFPGGDCTLYGFEPDTGKLIWKCDCNPTRMKGEVDNYFVSTPVIVGDRLYVGLGMYPENPKEKKYSYFVCLDVTKKGDVSLKSYDAKAPENKDSALVWAFGGLVEPRPERGRHARFGTTISTAAVHDGLVYIAEERGYIHCLDAKTGQRYWEFDPRASVWASPYYVDGKVYIGTEDGDVFIFAFGKERKFYADGKLQAAPTDKDKVKAAANMEERVHTTPVVAGGVLYIVTKSKLYAIANGK